jgi:glycosyltransferase involved in cell wall biosynthesis
MPNRSLRIAFCLSELRPPDSTESFFLQQMLVAQRLQARGHRLTYVAPVELTDMVCTPDLHQPVRAPRTWTRSAWFTGARRLVWRLQHALRVPYLNYFSNWCYEDACLHCLPGHDLVWERYGIYKVGVARACRRLGLPYILFFDGDDLYEHDYAGTPITGALRWRAQQLTREDLRAADRVLCVSNAAKRRLTTVWGVAEQKVEVFPNAVDIHLHTPQNQDRAGIRQRLGIGDAPMVLFVGGFFHWHDIAGLLDAFAQVLRDCPDAHLVLVGDGIKRDEMMAYAAQLGLQARAHFTGALPHAEIPRWVTAADVAAAPYRENPTLGLWGSPMKLFEYMASGAAVVATRLGQIDEVMRDGENGLLVPPSDPAALAAAILRLLQDSSLRARLGQQARQDAMQHYSWEQYMTHLDAVFASVLQPRNAPAAEGVHP